MFRQKAARHLNSIGIRKDLIYARSLDIKVYGTQTYNQVGGILH
jgi:hypothetical protein